MSSSEFKFGWELMMRQLFCVMHDLMGHVLAARPAMDPVHACMACRHMTRRATIPRIMGEFHYTY